MTTSTQLYLLITSGLLQAIVPVRNNLIARDAIPTPGWMIINGVFIGLALLPVLVILRHGRQWPRAFAAFLGVYPAFYMYAHVVWWVRG